MRGGRVEEGKRTSDVGGSMLDSMMADEDMGGKIV